jgi:hypothetical protein
MEDGRPTAAAQFDWKVKSNSSVNFRTRFGLRLSSLLNYDLTHPAVKEKRKKTLQLV